MRAALILLVLLFSTLLLEAQCTIVFRGKVVSSADNSTLPLATIELLDLHETTVTNEQGEFNFENLCSQQIRIRVRYLGFQTFEESIDLSIQSSYLEIKLQVDSQELAEVTVEANKAKAIASLKVGQIDEFVLSKVPAKSLGEVLTEFTGVNMLQTGPTITKPIIHGMHSNRILILNNGIRQEGQQWGQEHAPEIDPFMANNLELVKGAAAVKYGSDAIGGVILVNPDDLPRSGPVSGKISAIGATNNRLYSGSGIIEGGSNGFGWRVQGTYKKAGDAKAPDYRLTNTGMQELNYSLGLGYHKDDAGLELYYSAFDAEYAILRSSHFGNLTDLENAVGAERPLVVLPFSYDINNPYQKVRHQLAKINGHLDVEGIGELSAQYGFQHNQRKEFDIRRGGRSEIPSLSLDLYTHIVELDLEVLTSDAWRGDFGASFMYQNNENDPETGVRPLIPDFENWTAGAHGIVRYVQPNYELEAGLRYDFKHYLIKRFDENNQLLKPTFDFSNFTGSLGAVLFLTKGWDLRTNLGTAWRAPHVNELFSEGLHHGAAAIEEGNDSLRSERSIKWITTLTRENNRSRFELSAYYNYISDYIYLRPEEVALTIRGAFPVFRYQQTDASFMGLDVDYSYQLKRELVFSSKMSLIRAMDQQTESPLINIPPGQLEVGLEKTFRSKTLDNLFAGVNTRYVFEQRNAPRVVTVTEIRDAQQNDEDLFADDPSVFDILEVPEAYLLVNFNAGFALPLRNQAQRLEFFLSVDNVLNTRYRSYLNRFRYYADELGRNVNLRVNFNF